MSVCVCVCACCVCCVRVCVCPYLAQQVVEAVGEVGAVGVFPEDGAVDALGE